MTEPILNIEIPGPKGLQRIIGPLYYTINPLRALESLPVTFGDFSRLSDIVREAYFVSHPDMIEEVLVKKHASFQKDVFLKTIFPLLGKALLTSDGDSWKFQRALANPAFLGQQVQGYAKSMSDLTRTFMSSLSNSDTRDIHMDMMQLTLAIVLKTLFGTEIKEEAETISDAMNVVTKHFHFVQSVSSWMPNAHKVPIPLYFKNKKAEKVLEGVIAKLIAERRLNPGPDLLSQLIRAQGEKGEKMSDSLLAQNAFTMFVAGHETTALSLSFTWYLISKHPEVEKKFHQELDQQLSEDPTFETIQKLPYLDAVFKEALRLYPPAWIMGREANQDVEIKGFKVPKGAQVYFSQWVVHHDKRWFDNPWDFRPERWLEEQSRPKFSYFPFGGGPRVCIGQAFAQTEAKLILATIGRHYRIQCLDHKPLKLVPSVTLRPGNPIRYNPIRRNYV